MEQKNKNVSERKQVLYALGNGLCFGLLGAMIGGGVPTLALWFLGNRLLKGMIAAGGAGILFLVTSIFIFLTERKIQRSGKERNSGDPIKKD